MYYVQIVNNAVTTTGAVTIAANATGYVLADNVVTVNSVAADTTTSSITVTVGTTTTTYTVSTLSTGALNVASVKFVTIAEMLRLVE